MRTAEQDRAASLWLRPAVVAADPRLDVSVAQVRRYIADGELEAMDTASKGSKRPSYRINPESVEAFIRRRTRKAA